MWDKSQNFISLIFRSKYIQIFGNQWTLFIIFRLCRTPFSRVQKFNENRSIVKGKILTKNQLSFTSILFQLKQIKCRTSKIKHLQKSEEQKSSMSRKFLHTIFFFTVTLQNLQIKITVTSQETTVLLDANLKLFPAFFINFFFSGLRMNKL
jgi:hypothetical protein